ncbi:hypothetical protein AGMMS4952_14350 [Spirochaetia bacterium]|nr:hypothetical protein AGMMS4952_14350 [Spirochaetia bacterium]
MKPIRSIVLLIFITLVPSLYAQITFSAWGRGVVTPIAFSGDHSATSASTYTSSDNPSIGFTVNGLAPSEKIGFRIDFASEYDYGSGSVTAGIGDNAKVWVRPFKPFTLTTGFFKEEDLRGKFSASEFNAWILPNGGKGEDNIFQRFDAFAGAYFKIEPFVTFDNLPFLQGLTIQGAFGSNAPGTPGSNVRAILNLFNNEDNNALSTKYDESYSEYDGERVMSALDVFKAMQFAAGWKIPDIGLARFQFIGNNRSAYRWGEIGNSAGIVNVEKKLAIGLNTNRDSDILQIAFLLDRFQGIKADFGVTIPIKYTTKSENLEVYPRVVGTDGHAYEPVMNSNKDEYTVQDPVVIAAAGSWTPSFLSGLNITVRADIAFGGKKEGDAKTVETGSDVNIWLMPYYTLGYWKIGLDFGMEIRGKDKLTQAGINPNKAITDVSEYTDIGFAVWGELGFSGGRMRTGISLMLPGSERYSYNAGSATYKYSPRYSGDPVISIPISFTYSF